MSVIDEYQNNCALVPPENIIMECKTGVLDIEANYKGSEPYNTAAESYKDNPDGNIFYMEIESNGEQGYVGLTMAQAEEIISKMQHMVDYVKLQASK